VADSKNNIYVFDAYANVIRGSLGNIPLFQERCRAS
jgi:hypothetical protein